MRWVMMVGLAATLGACANEATIEARPLDDGESHSFTAPYSQTVAAARSALDDLKFVVAQTTEDEKGTIILYHRRVSGMTWGSVGRIYIKKAAQPPTMVYATYKKRMSLEIEGHGEEGFAVRYFKLMDKHL